MSWKSDLSRSERRFERQFRKRLAVPQKAFRWPGLLVCVLLTVLAAWLNHLPYPPFTTSDGLHPVSEVLLALLLGMALRTLIRASAGLKPGVDLVVRKLLPVGIILLGARLDFHTMLQVSLDVLLAVLVIIAGVVASTWLLGRLLGMGERLSLLIGVGTAICGSSAIVATAPVVDGEERDVALSIATVNLMGVLAMLLFPLLGALLELTASGYGVWCGLSIHATPQVLAAGFAHHLNGQLAGELSTIVKLTRISVLGPAVFVIGYLYARRRRRMAAFPRRTIHYGKLLPSFILLFLGMALLRTLGFFPEVTLHLTDRFILGPGDYRVDLALLLGSSARWMITGAMAGVGLMTDLRTFRTGGTKAFSLGLAATAVIALLGLVKISL